MFQKSRHSTQGQRQGGLKPAYLVAVLLLSLLALVLLKARLNNNGNSDLRAELHDPRPEAPAQAAGPPASSAGENSAPPAANGDRCLIWSRPVAKGERVSEDMLRLWNGEAIQNLEGVNARRIPIDIPEEVETSGETENLSVRSESDILRLEQLRLAFLRSLNRFVPESAAAATAVPVSRLLDSVPPSGDSKRHPVWFPLSDPDDLIYESLEGGCKLVILRRTEHAAKAPDGKNDNAKILAPKAEVLAFDRARSRICLALTQKEEQACQNTASDSRLQFRLCPD